MRILGSSRKNQGFGKKAAFNKNKPQRRCHCCSSVFFSTEKSLLDVFSVTTEERKGQIGHEHIPEYECNDTSIRKRNANMEIARKVAHL
jgi:hypothetical protein